MHLSPISKTMATAQSQIVNEKEKWSLPDQIEHLNCHIHLKEQNRKAYFEWSRLNIEQNELTIQQLRGKNKTNRSLLADSIRADTKIIHAVFENRKRERLSLQRNKAPNAVKIMDQKLCENVNKLNALQYSRVRRENKLKELQMSLQKVIHINETKTPEQLESEQRIRILENALDKAETKLQTAENISGKYECIVSRMKIQSMAFPSKLESTGSALIQLRAELVKLKVTKKESKEARDRMKLEMAVVEQLYYDDRKARETVLTATKKEIESRREEVERVQRQANRAYWVVDSNRDQRIAKEKQQKSERDKQILNLESTIARMMQATSISDISQFVDRYNMQKEKQAELTKQRRDSESLRNRLLDEKQQLQKQYHDARYSGDKRMSNMQANLDEKQAAINEHVCKSSKLRLEIEVQGQLLVKVKSGVNTIVELLKHVRLRPPRRSTPTGDVIRDLDLLNKKLEVFIYENGFHRHAVEDLQVIIQSSDFQLFVERSLSSQNCRIDLTESKTSFEDYSFTGQEDENILTREDIKRAGQALVDAKSKTKKRGGKRR
ncbi:outer dynein arm-docking complex subunit 3-like [Tubulanus polymorphus]|uniref:outer dynein arm-docking complex subunit 3-like n=1 Tax=Tubulanus polymorphus TaxID=672921 RepID=UPI003DA51BED